MSQTCTLPLESVIALAGSSAERPSQICIWRRKLPAGQFTARAYVQYAAVLLLGYVLALLVLRVDEEYGLSLRWSSDVSLMNFMCLRLSPLVSAGQRCGLLAAKLKSMTPSSIYKDAKVVDFHQRSVDGPWTPLASCCH